MVMFVGGEQADLRWHRMIEDVGQNRARAGIFDKVNNCLDREIGPLINDDQHTSSSGTSTCCRVGNQLKVVPPTMADSTSPSNGTALRSRPRPRAISNARKSFREQLTASSDDEGKVTPPNDHTRPPAGGTALFQRSPSSVAPVIRERGVESGLQDDAIYAAAMPRWRYAIRQVLVAQLRRESEWMAGMQRRLRTPLLDSFFYHTGLFGTHTFFMAALPVLFWFGDNHDAGRGLLYVTSMGIYVSSYAKDLACTPRPFSPPVIRLCELRFLWAR